ncbi:hypothetical protein RSPO_c01364 [Ralstonia solanacearum Po82]|uniref:Uncharacterized protein n=1 Tax=Ralstonia solanacearum (strain Po82) TaxID=1031711 RepID=F6G081_RALS8|nr:hypothetical protein RSPO_c01364 [Ralstonia solanacearum Po82]
MLSGPGSEWVGKIIVQHGTGGGHPGAAVSASQRNRNVRR